MSANVKTWTYWVSPTKGKNEIAGQREWEGKNFPQKFKSEMCFHRPCCCLNFWIILLIYFNKMKGGNERNQEEVTQAVF